MQTYSNRFLIDLSKISEFKEEHLDTHASFFNEKNNPEFFLQFADLGIVYEDTGLEESELINEVYQKLGNEQDYRHGMNQKYATLKERFNNNFDLRGKQIFCLYDGNPDDGEIIDIFSGNTTNLVLTKEHPNVTNRIVHKFRTTKHFNRAKLALIGGRFNSLDLEHDPIDWETVIKILKICVKENEIALPKNPNNKDLEKFRKECRDKINFVSNGRYSGRVALIAKLTNELEEQKTNTTRLQSIVSGADCLERLRNDPKNAGEYEDSKYSKWLSYKGNYDKVLGGFAIAHRNSKELWDFENNKPLVQGAGDPSKIIYNMILTFGIPDPINEVGFCRKIFNSLMKDKREVESLLQEKVFSNPVKTNQCNIEGFYNPSLLIEELSNGEIPFESVQSLETWEEFFKNNP